MIVTVDRQRSQKDFLHGTRNGVLTLPFARRHSSCVPDAESYELLLAVLDYPVGDGF